MILHYNVQISEQNSAAWFGQCKLGGLEPCASHAAPLGVALCIASVVFRSAVVLSRSLANLPAHSAV